MKWLMVIFSVLVLGGVVETGALASSGSHSRPPGASATLGRCPTHALALPAEAVARAADQARIQAPFLYKGMGPPVVVRSQRAAWAGARGAEVRAQCGTRAFHRTIVVDLLFPRMLPSASLSQGTVFVSRAPTGYRVWEQAH
jgi:hypothetical protein